MPASPAETHLALMHALGKALAVERSLEAALAEVIETICSTLEWDYGALWHEDEQTHHVTCVQMWHAPFLGGTDFIAMSRDTPFTSGPGGLVRATLGSRQPTLLEDVTLAPGLRRGAAAGAAGLKSALALPLTAGGQTLGALEFFSRTARRLDPLLTDTAGAVGVLLGEFIARREAENRYRELVDLSPDAIIIHCEGRYVFANQAAVQVLAANDVSQIIGRETYFLLHPDYERISRERVQHLYEGRDQVPRTELKYVGLDGRVMDVEVSSRYFVYAGKPAIQTIFRDVTERKRDEQRIVRLTHTHAALSETHKAIAKLSQPLDLFHEVCRIAVEHGRFQLAGVMEIAENGSAGHFVAANGQNDGQLLSMAVNLNPDAPGAGGPIAAAIREGVHFICNDILDDAGTVPWRELAGQSDFRSAGVFPLYRNAHATGVLAVLSRDAGIFDADLIELLDELALNLSFGLDSIERERQRSAAEARLQENERALSTLMRNLPGMAYRCRMDERRTLEFASEGCLQLTGYRPVDLVGSRRLSFSELAHSEDRARVAADIEEKLQRSDRFILEYRIVCADGSVKWISEKAQAIRDELGRLSKLEGMLDDVTDRRRFEEKLSFLAQYDVLTGLPNRALFYDRLRQAIGRARREQGMVGLLFLDLDRFKQINDSLGHAAGDRVLKTVAERLKGFLREMDTVARLGGDEFTVIVEGVSGPEQLAAIAGKIKASLVEPVLFDGRQLAVSTSIGITLYPRDADDVENLIKNADMAMYHAKNRGGRQEYQFYSEAMKPLAIGRMETESRLRRAIANQEFLLHYMPLVDMDSGRIVGMEALVRWRGPEGMVQPGDFIPLAEESGLILDIDSWVLRNACLQARTWQREGLSALRLSVNLSSLQFRQENLFAMVSETLRETGLSADLLELEITENAIMDRSAATLSVLHQLEELGVYLCIGDFGTGYSSLAHLKQFPVQRLKIDRTFVRDVTSDGDDAAIVSAMVAMSRTLGLKVVAEGVETRAQLDFLRAAGCELYQGHYFSIPLPAAAFAELVRRQRGSNG